MSFQAANTENLAFLPPGVCASLAINAKLIELGQSDHYNNFT
jgi:hypothetical protein